MVSEYNNSIKKMLSNIENNGYLLEDEIPLLIKLIKNKTLKLLTYTLCYSGRRISEALKLKPKDIHEDINEISWNILKKRGNKIIIKNKAAYPGLIETLIKYIKENNIAWNEYIFSTTRSQKNGEKHYTRQRCWSIIHEAGMMMEKNIHPHTLRHTYGILLAMNGASFKTIQDQLDHEYASTTQVYLDVAQVHVKEDLKKMDKKILIV